MDLRRLARVFGLLFFGVVAAVPGFGPNVKPPDVLYVPTEQAVVDEMLRMAKVNKESVVYDLGCGDGRIVITAATRYGARGVGIDIDPDRIQESRANAKSVGVLGRVRFIQGDLFQFDFHEATAVTLYLLSSLNVRLRPILLRQLKPGTPIVSHDFLMGDWQPDEISSMNGAAIFMWIVPARVAGVWQWAVDNGVQTERYELTLRQEFQKITGTLTVNGAEVALSSLKLTGDRLEFDAAPRRFSGQVDGEKMTGLLTVGNRDFALTATRSLAAGDSME